MTPQFVRVTLWCLAVGCGSATNHPENGLPQPGPRSGSMAPTPVSATEGRLPTVRERHLIQKLMSIAERTRGLRFREEVPVRIQTEDQILRHILQDLDEEELTVAKRVYAALGLLPEDIDIRELLERVLGEQVAGYYDRDHGLLVLRDEVMDDLTVQPLAEAGQAAPTIVHELVHALQHQHLNLGPETEGESESDRNGAYQSLVEGDATLAMIGALIELQGFPLSTITEQPDRIREFLQVANTQQGDPELEHAPAILRVTLLSSYFDGLLFCAALHQRGGFAAVDAAHRRRPVSSEQILHPARYLANEVPDAVAVPEQPALLEAGYSVLEDDQLGELEFGVYFGQRTDDTDRDAADGWNGDHLVAFERSDDVAVVWFSAWDSEQEAQEAEAAARAVAGTDQEHAVSRTGRGLLILRHVPVPLQASVVESFGTFANQLP